MNTLALAAPKNGAWSRFAAFAQDHAAYLTTAGAYPGVDLLRCLAVVGVLLYHFQLSYLGWAGVDLFFVISGFLIGGALLDQIKAGRFSFGRFYGARALRILPIYYFVIALCAMIKAPLSGVDLASPGGWQAVLSAATFTQGIVPYFFGYNLNQAFIPGGTWSLAIEEMFYLIAPAILVLLHRKAGGDLKTVLAGLVLLLLTGPFVLLWSTSGFAPNDPNWHFANFIQFHSRYTEILAGVVVAALIRLRDLPVIVSRMVAMIGAAMLGWFAVYMYLNPTLLAAPYLFTRETLILPGLFGVAFGCILLAAYRLPVRSMAVLILARLSYSLYLMHIFVIEIATTHPPAWLLWVKSEFTFYASAGILIAFSILVSYLTSLLVEYPFIRLYRPPAKSGS